MDLSTIVTPEVLASGGAVTWLLTNKELTNKILGPSAEYVGDLGKRFLEQALEKQPKNIANIIMKAVKKLGNKVDEPGAVEPRILKAIIEDGAFIEEDVVAEYYAGILASSRSEDGRNDSGLPYLKLLQSMSAFDLILHTLLYKTIQAEFKISAYQIGDPKQRNKMKLFIPYAQLSNAINGYFFNIDNTAMQSRITDAMFRFSQNDIIDNAWSLANKDTIAKDTNDKANVDGMYFTPSAIGVSLAMWGYGNGHLDNDCFFNCELNDDLNILPISQVIRLSDN